MPSNRTLRDSALLDQFGAFCRDERKELLRMSAEMKRDRDWFRDPQKLHDLCLYMIRDSSSMDEMSQTIHFVLSEPERYRAEYVVAACRLTDTKAA